MVNLKTRLDNDDHYEGGNTKEYIVIHDTGNVTDSDEGNANYFCTGSRDSSAHYFVDDDSITQVVKDDDCSWHCGDGGNAYGIGNRNSIGIEQCRVNGIVTYKTMGNTIELVAMLMKKYNITLDKVVRHYDASRKNCPASFNLDGKWTRWYEFKKQLNAYLYPVATPVKPTVDNAVLTIQKAMNRLRIVGANGQALVEDGVSGANTIFAIKKFQGICGLTQDGVFGNQTNNCVQQIVAKQLCGVPYVQRIPTRYIQFRLGLSIDGVFGSGTASAVKRYQANCGLVADGIFGNASWTKLIG